MRGEEHPHEKPVHVLKKLIKWATSPGDTVLDPFCGSGSTMVACVELDRRGIGIELDPVHFATAQRRIAEAQRRKYDQPVLLEVE